jgi:hypothetical protein
MANNLVQDIRCPGRDMNQTPCEYKSWMLLVREPAQRIVCYVGSLSPWHVWRSELSK